MLVFFALWIAACVRTCSVKNSLQSSWCYGLKVTDFTLYYSLFIKLSSLSPCLVTEQQQGVATVLTVLICGKSLYRGNRNRNNFVTYYFYHYSYAHTADCHHLMTNTRDWLIINIIISTAFSQYEGGNNFTSSVLWWWTATSAGQTGNQTRQLPVLGNFVPHSYECFVFVFFYLHFFF